MTRRSYSATDRALKEIAAPVTPEDVCRAGNGIRIDAAGRHAPYRQPDDPGVDAPEASELRLIVWVLVGGALTVALVLWGVMTALAAG